jgi:hypothetical protein
MTSKQSLRLGNYGSRIEYEASGFYSSKEQLVENLRVLLRIADWLKSLKKDKILKTYKLGW